MKKFFILIAIVALATNAQAQNKNNTASAPEKKKELTKEITLEKDFVPVERKVEKKNTLPSVQKALTKEQVALKYSDWAVPAPVPAIVPTMMPYGYRTAHNFSEQRGYFRFGAGSQANVSVSAGYQIVDNLTTKLSVWLQHNSTWGGKNASPLIVNDDERMTQKYNDNFLYVDFSNQFSGGTVGIAADVRLDRFNYYAGYMPQSELGDHDITPFFSHWEDFNQTFHNVGITASWNGATAVSGNDLNYHLGIGFHHSGYAKPEFGNQVNGSYLFADSKVNQKNLSLCLGGDYRINDESKAGVNIDYTLLKTNIGNDLTALQTAGTYSISGNNHKLNVNPFFEYAADNADLHLGARIIPSFGDNKKLRFAPDVKVNLKLAPGMGLFANATGDLRLNTFDVMHDISRYSNYRFITPYTYTPVDMEVGLNIGAFQGFSMKLFAGYALTENNLWATLPSFIWNDQTMTNVAEPQSDYALGANFTPTDAKGFKIGAEVNFKYQSLVEFTAGFTFAPQKDSFSDNGDYKACLLDVDAPEYVGKIDLSVFPINRLSVNLGLDLKGGRRYLYDTGYQTQFLSLDNIINLRANAQYRITKSISAWISANNLLNRRYDVLPYMGAQRLSVMGGVEILF